MAKATNLSTTSRFHNLSNEAQKKPRSPGLKFYLERRAPSPTACQYILPNVLREFKESFPQCVIHIEPGDTPVALELLHNHRIDLALALEPRNLGPLEFRPLFRDQLQFLVSSLHDWAKNRRVERGNIVDQRFILYNRTSYMADLIETYFRNEGIVLPTFIELGNMEAIKELVKLGLGISLLPLWSVSEDARRGSLCILRLANRQLFSVTGVLYRKSAYLPTAVRALLGVAQDWKTWLPHAGDVFPINDQ